MEQASKQPHKTPASSIKASIALWIKRQSGGKGGIEQKCRAISARLRSNDAQSRGISQRNSVLMRI